MGKGEFDGISFLLPFFPPFIPQILHKTWENPGQDLQFLGSLGIRSCRNLSKENSHSNKKLLLSMAALALGLLTSSNWDSVQLIGIQRN